jgi:CHASE3 domain sensor protein
MNNNQDNNSTNDHDLLIRVDTRLEMLIREMQLMRDTTKEQINNKVDKATFQDVRMEFTRQLQEMTTENDKAFKIHKDSLADHEKRMRRIEYSLYIGFGLLMAVQFFFSIYPIIIKQ